MAEQLQAISSSATTSSIVKNIPSKHSSSPSVVPTLLTDQDLARRMQFYVIVKMFGATVISQTFAAYTAQHLELKLDPNVVSLTPPMFRSILLVQLEAQSFIYVY